MDLEQLKELTWEGYLRSDGSKGIRNKVMIVYTVECSSYVAKQVALRMNHPDVEVIGFDG